MIRSFLLALTLSPFSVVAQTTMLVNARIHTVDAGAPRARALAWEADGRLVFVGGAAAARERFPDATVIDAGGRTVVPGLIDAHAHLMGLGLALMRADLTGTTDKADVIARLQAFAADLPADGWLLGRGWDQNDWPEQRYPTAADLDAAFPGRPVWLGRIDGHAGWANTAAMRAAGVDLSGDWQPDGGRILRQDGEPTGIFVDTAAQLVEKVAPPPSEEALEQALERALAAAARHGLTGVHDAGTSLQDLARYRRFADAGRLTLRVYAMADGDAAALQALCAMGRYEHAGGRLAMRALKLYADGALGSRGAALLADYSDEPGHRGLLVTAPDALRKAIDKAVRCGVQVATHAIGDRGNRGVLDAYARWLPGKDLRWRIEHAQLVALQDIARFATLEVIASVQPTHATSDMPWAGDRVGESRLAGAYAWQRFRDAGARLALGSDFPVESVDPMLGLYAAVTRQDRSGHPPGGWLPSQRLTPEQALRGFTIDAAYAGFAEDRVGSLAVGKRADFVVLSEDPLAVAPAAVDDIRVLATYVDGRAVYRAGNGGR
ncbi:MAG TPA: amidohydrolase [Xanthomonadaceae bacterium]|nr:amidohydrolase [Xanthomonadaceae bacterium]